MTDNAPDFPCKLTDSDINDILENQLAVWPLAKQNFDRLREVKRKPLEILSFPAYAQFNPARIRSTAANVDKKAIEERPCFLCRENRPKEQVTIPWMKNWDLLVNPYPILPVHFTIASTTHVPQNHVPMDIVKMAEAAPSLVFFFNGAKAGASAPDHLHLQAVLKSELPLMRIVEKYHPHEETKLFGTQFDPILPFEFASFVIKPDEIGTCILKDFNTRFGPESILNGTGPGTDLLNAFFWMDDDGYLRMVLVPRSAHRPKCYYSEGDDHLTVSPGAIDMAGIIVLPVEEDFNKITWETAYKIYRQVGC